MKRVLVAAACTLLLGLVATQAAAETKWVRGKVTAVGGDSVTLDVMGKPMTFKVDSKTDVVARGGATATRQAQAAGQKGAALADIIKVGDGVEVHYNEMGSTMMATERTPRNPTARRMGIPRPPGRQRIPIVSGEVI